MLLQVLLCVNCQGYDSSYLVNEVTAICVLACVCTTRPSVHIESDSCGCGFALETSWLCLGEDVQGTVLVIGGIASGA